MKKSTYGFIVFFISALFVVYAFCLNTAGAVFADTIKTTLHTSDVAVSAAIGSFIFGFACMQIPAGYLLDRYNARFIIPTALLLLVIGNVAISFSTNIYIFSLANLIQGMGASFDFIGASVLISQWFAPKMFPILTGFIETAACIAAAIIHYSLIIILKNMSWQEVYLYISFFGFMIFVFAIMFIKSPADHKFSENISIKQSLKIVLRNKQNLLCALGAATSFGVALAYAGFWYIKIQEYYFVSSTEAGIIGGLIFVGIGIGTPIWGWISNLCQSRKLILHITLVTGNMLLLLAIYLPHFNITSFAIIKTISLLLGFLLAGSMLFYTIVSEMANNSTRGVAISITNSSVFLFNSIILLIPHLFITKISALFFTYMWILPFCMLISILCLGFIKETYGITHEKIIYE